MSGFAVYQPPQVPAGLMWALTSNSQPKATDLALMMQRAAAGERTRVQNQKDLLEIQQAQEAAAARRDPNLQAQFVASAAPGANTEIARKFLDAVNRVDLRNPNAPQVDDEPDPETGMPTPSAASLPAIQQMPEEVTPVMDRAMRAAMNALLANTLATGKTSGNQLTDAVGDAFKTITQSAVQTAPNVPAANQLSQSIGGPIRTPMRAINAGDMGPFTYSGETGQGGYADPTRAAQGREALGARIGRDRASADNSSSAANERRVLLPDRQRELQTRADANKANAGLRDSRAAGANAKVDEAKAESDRKDALRAERVGKNYKNAESVREAVRSGRLSRDDAILVLRHKFGMK